MCLTELLPPFITQTLRDGTPQVQMIFIVLSFLETVHDTVHYRYYIFSLLYHLLRITLKRQNPLLSYILERERENVHHKCTILCTVHFIITLFNVGNVLCIIYQLIFTVFITFCIYVYRSVLSSVSRNHGRSWNVLPTDMGVCRYSFPHPVWKRPWFFP